MSRRKRTMASRLSTPPITPIMINGKLQGMAILSKKTIIAGCILAFGCILILSIGYKRSNWHTFQTSESLDIDSRAEQSGNNFRARNSNLKETSTRKDEQLQWTPELDIIDEQLILKETPLYDIKKGVCPTLSRTYLIDNPSEGFTVGDEIKIGITMLDGYGHVRKRGGDQLKVRIYEDQKNASASGYIIDHQNGTYTAVTRALWKGKPNIAIISTYPREVIRAWYNALVKIPALRLYHAIYHVKNGTNKVRSITGMCHPFLFRVSKGPGSYCNRTEQNDGMSLFCYKPKSVKCSDFIQYSILYSKRKPRTFTMAETELCLRYGEVISKILQISVTGSESFSPDVSSIPMCSKYDRSKLWLKASPIGYFFDNSWRTLHCTAPSKQSIDSCLRGKHFAFIGDSTLRQWFTHLQSVYDCRFTDLRLASHKACISKTFNMSAEYVLHAIPGHYIFTEPVIHSIARFIDKYSFGPNRILVFHMQCHLSCNHLSVFKDRMLHIRKAIDGALKKHKVVKIFFKGPHTFEDHGDFGDYFGYVYRTIMLRIFKGLFGKIVYLDNKDITISRNESNYHPSKEAVKGMVDQFLSYLCD